MPEVSFRRIAINGGSGSGKSTLARQVSQALTLPYHELDALMHGAGWTPRPTFVDDVRAAVAGPGWVMEYQYDSVRPLILQRADCVVWLDLPTWVTMWQLMRRTVTRRLTRAELWNGNREGPLWRVLVEPDHVLRWGWRTRRSPAERIAAITTARPDLPVVRLRSRRDVARWVAQLDIAAEPRARR